MRVRVGLFLIIITTFLCANVPFYSVQTHFGQYRRADMDSLSVELQLDLIEEAGIGMIRDECLWSDVETDSGVYVIPTEVDHYVQAARSRDIDVYLILNYNNTFYAPGNGSGVTTEANRVAYAKYCQAVVSHFSPLGVKHYEIWNEPNHGVLFWTPQPDANDYTALLHTAYDSIKAIDTTVTVVGCATSPAIGNPSPFIEGLDFIRDVFAAGGGNYMDAVSFHLYQIAYRPEYEFHSYVNSVKSYVGDMPIYFSEFGYPTHEAWPNITLERQARYVTRMYLTCATDPQIRSVVHYDLKNDGTVAEEPEHNFGLLQFNRTPKPAYTALKHLIQSTDAKRPLSHSSENDLFTSKISDSLYIAWTYSGSSVNNISVDADVVRVEGIMGDTLLYHVTANDSIDLSISEDPVYCFVQDEEPVISELKFQHHEYLIYQGESIKCFYESNMADGTPVVIDPSAINWSHIGISGTMDGRSFTAQAPGQGVIVAEFQGKCDTMSLNIIEDPGYYTAEEFSDTNGFLIESGDVISSLSTREGDGWNVLTLDYEYSGTSASAYLYKDILINHHADSISLDFKTDDKEYEFRIYCKDGNGVSYTLGLRPRPTDWTNSWKTLKGPMSIDDNATPPVRIEKIYIKFKPGSTTQTEPYSGQLMFDYLRLKKGDAVGVQENEQIPHDIHLSQNYPNPFNGNTRISFTLPRASTARIDIFDLNGKIVNTAINKTLEAGKHDVNICFDNMPSGVYIYRLSAGSLTKTHKLVYLK